MELRRISGANWMLCVAFCSSDYPRRRQPMRALPAIAPLIAERSGVLLDWRCSD